jgi:hypothetical protein
MAACGCGWESGRARDLISRAWDDTEAHDPCPYEPTVIPI